MYDDLATSVITTYSPKIKVPEKEQQTNLLRHYWSLHQIDKHCDYNDSFQDMLQDHQVCRANHLAIKCMLLAERDVTCDRAQDIAKPLETSEKGSHNITAY